jgi:molybdopterin-containing oxidoreductase family iron-sulfur binding subunit
MTLRPQWRSLEQLADTPRVRAWLEREYPAVTDLCRGPERRQFLRLMAASLALAGLSGCDDQDDGRDQEVPYVRNPNTTVPGSIQRYASSTLLDGLANGVLVTTRDGRPLKIEGNPDHPWTAGATDPFMQASVLDLYDPARSQTVARRGEASDWQALRGALIGPFAALKAQGGTGFHLLTAPLSSPSLLAQIDALRQALPRMHWHSHAAVGPASRYAGTRLAFGRPLETRWRFDRARVLVSLDGDFLDPGPHQAGVSRAWSDARGASAQHGPLLALHAAASVPNLTFAQADYHVTATPSALLHVAQSLLADLNDPAGPPPAGTSLPLHRWRTATAAALHANRGHSLVLAGSTAPPALQEVAHRLNAMLGNAGNTVFYTDPVLPEPEPLEALVGAMQAGEVSTLLILGCNPAYDAPGDLAFTAGLDRVPLKLHAGLYLDETGLRCDWHMPLAHPLESWGDARAPDGTASLIQPTIAPLYEGRSAAEILSLLADSTPRAALDLLRDFWQGAQDAGAFAPAWQAMLRAGFIAGSALPEQAAQPLPAASGDAAAPAAGLEVVFRPDPTVWDGRFANNGWLQELPKPLTKLVWENAVAIGPSLAERASLSQGDVVRLDVDGRSIEGPVWIMPGQADGVVGVTLGYGRDVPEVFPENGYNAFVLRGAAEPWLANGATLHKTGRSVALVTTQDHNTMEGHDFIHVQREGDAPPPAPPDAPGLYAPPGDDGSYAWGMVIDLDACIGCNACVVACQAENNIAVVGREQVALGREMHWLRVDRYYEGPTEAPETHFQPVPCMHCEQAPCEVGCPVEATLHDSDGLNLMVYNRCVGTRACSGYCPYKVRHFNYLDYSAGAAPSLQLQRNPQVTVRARGVMEKCTYCVQRIEAAHIEADKASARIPGDSVQTACAGACPTRAITFGDLNDPNSAVARARRDPRHYALLGELNTKPRTTYLAERAPRGAGAA